MSAAQPPLCIIRGGVHHLWRAQAVNYAAKGADFLADQVTKGVMKLDDLIEAKVLVSAARLPPLAAAAHRAHSTLTQPLQSDPHACLYQDPVTKYVDKTSDLGKRLVKTIKSGVKLDAWTDDLQTVRTPVPCVCGFGGICTCLDTLVGRSPTSSPALHQTLAMVASHAAHATLRTEKRRCLRTWPGTWCRRRKPSSSWAPSPSRARLAWRER